MQQNAIECQFTASTSWVVLSPIEQRIKEKIEAVGIPLKDWNINIYRGVLTGCNEAFVITGEKRQEILDNCLDSEEFQRTDALIRPILRGRDIQKYEYNWQDLWLISTFPAFHYSIEDYPAVKNYLLTFGENILRENGYDWIVNDYLQEWCHKRLLQTGEDIIINNKKIIIPKNTKSRKQATGEWFETQDSIAYWEDFLKPKIIYPNMTKYLPFVYDEESFITNQKCFIITGEKIAYLTAFFNSSLFKYCFRDSFPELQGGTRELSKIFFDKIPVLEVDQFVNDNFENLIRDIQTEYTKEKAIILDTMLFDLYELTEEERLLIGFFEIL